MHLYYDDWLTPKKGNYPLPCQSIESLTYDYSETKGVDRSKESRFMVMVHFPNLKYRQIEHVQEYDFESLVGNIGGYIGLFLGYSLINFPRFIISLIKIIRKKLMPIMQKNKREKRTQNRSLIYTQSPRINPIEASEVNNVESATFHNQNNTQVNNTAIRGLKNVGNDLVAVRKNETRYHKKIDDKKMVRIDGEVSFQTSLNDYFSDERSITPRSPILKVKITEWNNQAQTPCYI